MSETTKKLGYAGEMGLETWMALQKHYLGQTIRGGAITCGDRQLDGITMKCDDNSYNLSNVDECVQIAGRAAEKNAIDGGDLMSCFVDDLSRKGRAGLGHDDLEWHVSNMGIKVAVYMSERAVREVLVYHGIQLKPAIGLFGDGPLNSIKPQDVIATNAAYRKLAGIDERLSSITGKELLKGFELMIMDGLRGSK